MLNRLMISSLLLLSFLLTACATPVALTPTLPPPPSATAPAPTVTLPPTAASIGTPTLGPTVTPVLAGACQPFTAGVQAANKLITLPMPRNTTLSTPAPRVAQTVLSAQNIARMEPLAFLLSEHPPVWDIAFTHDSQTLLAADASPVTRWEVASGQLTTVVASEPTEHILALSLDVNRTGSLIATGGGTGDNMPRLWDMATGSLANEFLPHDAIVQSVAFNSDGSRLASGDNNNVVRVWDTATGQLQGEYTGNSKDLLESFTRLYWLGETTLVGGGAAGVYWWETYTGEQTAKLTKPSDMPFFREIALNPAQQVLVSVHQDEAVRLWNLADQSAAGTLPPIKHGALFTVDISPDGTLIAAGADDGSLWVWDVVARQPLVECAGPGGSLTKVRFSPDGRYIAALSIEDTVWLWGVP